MMPINMQGGQQQNNGMPDWLANALGMGTGAGSIAGGLFNLFGPKGKNPADVANKYISQIPGQTQQYYQPYMEAGKGALGDLQNRYKDLMGGGVQNQLGESYKQSPGYQFALKQALQAGNAASAAGGMLGTPAHEQQNMEIAQGLAAKDYQDYINNQIGLYGAGLGGEGNINQMGFDASKDYASNIANALSQQGAYGYSGQAGQNASRSGGIGDIFSGLGMLGGGILSKIFGV